MGTGRAQDLKRYHTCSPCHQQIDFVTKVHVLLLWLSHFLIYAYELGETLK